MSACVQSPLRGILDVSERQNRMQIGMLKQKGFISVSIQNRNDRMCEELLKVLPDGRAHPVVIRAVGGCDRHRIALGNLGHRPAPVFRMAVGK